MKRVNGNIHNSPGWTVTCEYIDVFGERWLAPYPFYPWSYRMKEKR